MLRIEKLVCKNAKFHKDCVWRRTTLKASDEDYPVLKRKIQHEIRVTKTAYRIVHDRLGIVTTLKWGHDNRAFIQEDRRKLARIYASID
jgi:hypothetical protein